MLGRLIIYNIFLKFTKNKMADQRHASLSLKREAHGSVSFLSFYYDTG